MKLPPTFARHAMDALKEPAKDPEAMMQRLEEVYPKSAALLWRHTGKSTDSGILRDLRLVHDALKKGGANRGRRDLNRSASAPPAGSAKGNGKGEAKGNG